MPSGILQLLVTGAQDKILISNPQINHFKQVYKKHSNFSIFNYELPITSQIDFNGLINFEIPKNGDLLRRIQIKVELPSLAVEYNNPLDVEIENIKKKNSYKSIDQSIYDYNLYNLNTLKGILDYELNNTTSIPSFELFSYNSNTKVETYSVVIPKIDLSQFITTSTNEYYFEINPNKLIFDNSSVNFSYPLIDTPVIDTNSQLFYNKMLLYSNRNTKLSPAFNVVNNLYQQNDTTTLLTSNNIKNIFMKNIKESLFSDELFAALDSLYKYINSIRFVRPIELYDDTIIKNILHGSDSDLIGYPEYNETYFSTIDLQSVLITTTVLNTLLNSTSTRLIYVLTTDGSGNQIMFNKTQYGLYNILKFDYIKTSVLNSSYNELGIVSTQYLNYTQYLSDASNISVKITPFSSNYTNEFNNFSQLLQINRVTQQINSEYKIEINEFNYSINLINKYIYFYYNVLVDSTTLMPFCIFNISKIYTDNGITYIYANPIKSVGVNFNINQIYLIDNQYLIKTQLTDDFNLKKIDVSLIDIDSYNLYKNYISIPNNINFNLDGSITTENNQKILFQTNVSNYILTNTYDNYAVIYNILKTMFKNPYEFLSTQSYAKNLYYKVLLNNDGASGYSMSGFGLSTFTEQDQFGNSIMIKYLTSVLKINFNGLTIVNNYYLSLINSNINNYNAVYQQNWNNINNILQKAPYMRPLLKTINFIENTPLYIKIKLDDGTINTIMNLTSQITQVYVYDHKFNYITILNLSSKNCVVINNKNYIFIYIADLDVNNINDPFLLKYNYYMEYVSNTITYRSVVKSIEYIDTNYTDDLTMFINGTTLLNPNKTIHGNYIYTDYILSLYDYLDVIYNIYLSNKYNATNILTILNPNLLYKYVTVGYHNFINILNARLKIVIAQQTVDTSTYLTLLTDYEYLTNTLKVNDYFYNTIINDYYNRNMINGYNFHNSYSNVNTQVSNMIHTHTSFSNFINSKIDTDLNINQTSYGIILKTYLYYNAGSQLEFQYFSATNQFLKLATVGIRDPIFNTTTIANLNANLIANSSSIYDGSNIANYLNSVDPINYNSTNYQFKMNPHLYYSYLNLGYIENLLSLDTYGNIDLPIKNYTDFTYSDIDNVIASVLGFYTGQSYSYELNGVIYMDPTTTFYSNVLLNTSIKNELLIQANISNSIILNDLVYYSSHRYPTTGASPRLISMCNVYVTDVKEIIKYFNDNIDNLEYIRFILLNDTSISGDILYNKIHVSKYSDFNSNGINDYTLQYFSSDLIYQYINKYRSSYGYNTLLSGFDTDSQAYYDYIVSINNSILIGSSLKQIYDKISLLYSGIDVYTLVGRSRTYENISVNGLDSVKTYIINTKQDYSNNYNKYLNNKSLLDLQDNVELNTINDTIKNINIRSGEYIPSLSSIDQFNEYNRYLFGYKVDTNVDYIYDVSASVTHIFSKASNIANIELYNIPLLTFDSYETFSKTYEFQLRRIKSYFNTDTKNLNDDDIEYLKSLYALENKDVYYYDILYIPQINKLYNYDIPSDISANIADNNKLDNNFNQPNYNIDRNINNANYYAQTLKILDTGVITQADLTYMINFLTNNVIYVGYKINSDTGTRIYTYKDPYSLVDFGTITFFSTSLDTLLIPIINTYVYSSIDLTILTTNDILTIFYYNFMYLMHDLFLLDGKMRVKYSDVSGINSKYYNSSTYKDVYKKLVTEYFHLILRGKEIVEEADIDIIHFSKIYSIINVDKNYDKLVEYLLYSNLNTDNSYDLYYINTHYNILEIIRNHSYAENYAIIYSIKDSINDLNFSHLINLTNYNNKYLQFYDKNSANISNVTLLQNLYLANLKITNDYKFFQNIVVTNNDYNKILTSKIFNPDLYTALFDVDSSYGNIILNMNDIRDVKTNIINHFLNEMYISNSIINSSYLNNLGNGSIQSILINNLEYKGNKISEINIDLKNKQFNLQKFYNPLSSFNPLNIPSLTAWFDSSDKAHIYKDIYGTITVLNNNDKVAKWQNKASTGEIYQMVQANSNIQPTWNINGGLNFNSVNYFNTVLNLNTSSTLFLVTDTSTSGGYNMYFDNGNVYQANITQGPTIWSDGPFGNYIYDDYTFNIEVNYGFSQMGINIFSMDRVDGNYIEGYNNGYTSFRHNIEKSFGTLGNVTMSVLPGYIDIKNKLAESFTGNIYEILIFNTVLSDEDRFNVNLYLGNKWNNKYKINYGSRAEYYTFDFDYLPKLYKYNIANGNVIISHNHYYDQTFANIYETIYTEYDKIYKDITYKISNNLDFTTISGYLYFTDFINDIKSITVKHEFNYDLSVSDRTFTISDSNIYISNDVINNYTNYISEMEEYKNDISIKDSFELILDPLKFDTDYNRYSLMNFKANIYDNSNIYFQKLPRLIQKTSTIAINYNERFYQFNDLINILYVTSLTGYINYDKLNLPNTYIGNVLLPKNPLPVFYNLAKFDYTKYQTNDNSNILILNEVIDINNQLPDLYDEQIRIYNNTLLKIDQMNDDIKIYNKTNNEINLIKQRPPVALISWIEKLGFYLADYFELYIGGELIERVEDNFSNCFSELHTASEMKRALSKMIGQDERLILKQSKIGTYTLYLDIPFYFNRYKKMNGLAIPLIALLYNKLNLKFKIKALTDLIECDPYTKVTQKGKLKMNLMLDYILLDHAERKKFAESKHEYIIEQVQYSTYIGSSLAITNQIKLNFRNPTKMMIWFAQLKDKIKKKQYYNYTMEDYYLNIKKYIDKDETSNKYLDYLSGRIKYLITSLGNRDPTNQVFNKQQILKMPFENHDKALQADLEYTVQPSSDPIIKQSELKVNGHTRFLASSDETQLIRPYTYFSKSEKYGINVYNFNLYPTTTQPSGSINFSFLNDINLLIDFNNINLVDKELTVKTMTISYNMLRIMSGYGGLAFDTI
jgi:hypothetical protein